MNQSQPQTLQIAVFLLYGHAFFTVLDYLRQREAYQSLSPWGYLLVGAAIFGVLAARGIASEAKWGYIAGIFVAVSPLIFRYKVFGGISGVFKEDVIGLIFEIALIAALVHPQSREYQRIWFK